MIGLAESVGVIYAARVLSGMSYGLAYAVMPMYLGEIASDNIRGAISTLLTVMAKLGILYAFSIGPYVSVRTMSWLALIPAICFLASFSFLPETPYYYLGKDRYQDAKKSLSKLRHNTDVDEELKTMEIAVKKSKDNKGTIRELFITRGNRISIIIMLGLGAVQQLCGSQAIIAYSETIFNKVHIGLSGSELSIVLAVVQLTTAAISSSVVDRVGRRPLLLISIIGAAICNTIVGIYFNLERYQVNVDDIGWLAVLAIMVFIVCYTVGMATVTFALLAELFPKNLKAVAGAVYTVNSSVFAFAITKLFQVVSDGLGSDYTFFGFAIFSYLFIPFVWYLIPETKGKSLDVILEEMNTKQKSVK